MYPFFSGLCGYVFGTNRAGNLDPSDIGLDAPRFLRNAPLIDALEPDRASINAKVDDSAGRDAFLNKRAAFWITGPWNVGHAQEGGHPLPHRPDAADPAAHSVPFLGVQGFMVTKFASQHGVESAAKDLVGNYMIVAGLADGPRRGERPLPGEHARRRARVTTRC